MEIKPIYFVVANNNDFCRLEVGKALLHLIEFDFTYFWEKCIEAGRQGRKSGRLPTKDIAAIKSIIADAHPYIAALINEDFNDIIIDCIIEYICHSEHIGLEELWVRCISPKNLYEDAIFKRISVYKTGKGINEWGNIVKIQEYARNKLMFIYDTDEPRQLLSRSDIKVRRDYFDLACTTAANELGISSGNLPAIKVCSPASAPNSAFIMGRVSRVIYYRFAEAFKLGGDLSVNEGMDCRKMYDQFAMDAYSYVRGMKRPEAGDMQFAADNLRDIPDEIYMPDSFKSVVDLEFDEFFRQGIVMRRCENCGRFFLAEGDVFFCNRVTSSGQTCAELNPPSAGELSKAKNPPSEKPASKPAAEKKPASAPAVQAAKEVEIPPELEKQSQRIYNVLYRRVGKAMDENEFREWSQYLSNLKRNVKIGEAGLPELTDFLDYSDRLCQEVKNAVKNKTGAKHGFDYAEKHPVKAAEDDFRPLVQPKQAAQPLPDEQPEPAKQAPQTEHPDVVHPIKASSANVKPFRPEAFDSLFDAYVANHTDSVEEVAPQKREYKEVEIKAPQWQHLTREEAYGTKK